MHFYQGGMVCLWCSALSIIETALAVLNSVHSSFKSRLLYTYEIVGGGRVLIRDVSFILGKEVPLYVQCPTAHDCLVSG